MKLFLTDKENPHLRRRRDSIDIDIKIIRNCVNETPTTTDTKPDVIRITKEYILAKNVTPCVRDLFKLPEEMSDADVNQYIIDKLSEADREYDTGNQNRQNTREVEFDEYVAKLTPNNVIISVKEKK